MYKILIRLIKDEVFAESFSKYVCKYEFMKHKILVWHTLFSNLVVYQ